MRHALVKTHVRIHVYNLKGIILLTFCTTNNKLAKMFGIRNFLYNQLNYDFKNLS